MERLLSGFLAEGKQKLPTNTSPHMRGCDRGAKIKAVRVGGCVDNPVAGTQRGIGGICAFVQTQLS